MWVIPITDYPERFVDLREVYVGRSDGWIWLPVAEARLIGGRPALRLEAVTSPEEARRWANCELAVGRDEVVTLPEGTHYVFDLIGCRVYEAETGVEKGELTDVHQYPANDVYVVRSADGKTLQVPAVRAFVKLVDVASRRIEIDSAGLTEDQEA